MTRLLTRTAATAAAIATCMATATAQHASPYHAKLDACLKAAKAAPDYDPTDFKCDWKTVLKGAPGSALTGKFDLKAKGAGGTMTILEHAGGPALVAFQTVSKPQAHTCTAQLTATRGNDDALAARSDDAKECSVRIVSSGPNLVRVTAKDCSHFCGAGASFSGDYKLRMK